MKHLKKKAKKILLLVLASAMLVGGSVMGTIAYLTAKSETVTNTFTVGNVKITLNEAELDPEGRPTGYRTSQGNHYRLLPGKEYIKDPTLTIKQYSEDCYARLKVTISHYDTIKDIFGSDFLPQNYVNDTWDSSIWIPYGTPTVSTKIVDGVSINCVTYEFRYHEIIKRNVNNDILLPALFRSFTIPGTVNGEDLAKLQDMTIDVVGEAIQADTFADANAAWVAFDAQYNP